MPVREPLLRGDGRKQFVQRLQVIYHHAIGITQADHAGITTLPVNVVEQCVDLTQ